MSLYLLISYLLFSTSLAKDDTFQWYMIDASSGLGVHIL